MSASPAPAGHAVPVSITRRFNQYPILSPLATNFSESGENRGREKKSGHAAAAPWKNFVLPYRPAPRLYRSVGRGGAERSLDRPPTERRTRRSVFALGSNTCRFLPIHEDRSAIGVNGDGARAPTLTRNRKLILRRDASLSPSLIAPSSPHRSFPIAEEKAAGRNEADLFE